MIKRKDYKLESYDDLKYFIPGNPVGKQRARVVSGHAYTPLKTRIFEDTVRYYALSKFGNKKPYDGDVRVTVELGYAIPKSWPKWKKEAAARNDIRPAKKPDVDNVLKSVLDGMNTNLRSGKTGIYLDDKQVIYISCEKWYSSNPGVWVWVEFI